MIQRTKYQQYACARKEHTFFIPWQTIGCPQMILRWFSVFCRVSRCFWYRSFGVQKSTEDLWLPAPFAFYLFLLRSDWFMFPVNLSER
jgi:hypothetical protein